eukprot:12014975-Alexandrium_andersonii.AAC.1
MPSRGANPQCAAPACRPQLIHATPGALSIQPPSCPMTPLLSPTSVCLSARLPDCSPARLPLSLSLSLP